MQLTMDRKALLAAVERMQGVTHGKTTVPILSHVLIEVRDNNVYVDGTDLETGIHSIIPSADSELSAEDGKFTLNARKLFEVLRASDAESVTLKSGENDWIHVTLDRAKFKLMGLDPRSFPAMPTDKGEREEAVLAINAATLCEMIDKVIFAVSADEARYTLSGVYIEAMEGGVRLVATDGHRLATIDRPALEFGLQKGVILPRKGVVEARKLLDGYEGEVSLKIDASGASLGVGDTALMIRLVEGEFPDYRGAIPAMDNRQSISAPRKELESAVKRARIMSNKRFSGVKLSIGQEPELTVSSNSPDTGEAHDLVSVNVDGVREKDLAIGINAVYLLDALHAIPEDGRAVISVSDEVSPMVVTTPGDEHYKVVIMPCRV